MKIPFEKAKFRSKTSPAKMKEADWGILLPRIRRARRVKITEGNSTRPPTAKLMYRSPANNKM